MSAPVTLLRDANGDLWYKHFKIDEIRFDQATRMGYIYGTNLAKNSTVLVSISAEPTIQPMTRQGG